MALEGNLRDIDVADLIQLNCQSGARARLTAQRGDEVAELYFDAGQVVHAESGNLRGAEAAYRLLAWESGRFELEKGIAPPDVTISIPWSALILEGMRRLDEAREGQEEGAEETAAEKIEKKVQPRTEKELEEMAVETRKERLEKTLRSLVEGSSDIQGVAVISMDGLIISAVLPQGMERTRVGAVAAGILSLSGRSIEQLKRGTLQRTLVQGSEGNVVLTQAGKNAAFAALTGQDVNLGLVFLEAREGAEAVAEILG